jgi:hypothetical protein
VAAFAAGSEESNAKADAPSAMAETRRAPRVMAEIPFASATQQRREKRSGFF